MQTNQSKYDVVICGAGLAGLTLARQLRKQLPGQSILLIDRMKRPLPEAAHKVGESTVHPGGTYLCKVIDLKEYLDSNHVEKYGLRYYYGNNKDDFSTRAEVGRAFYDEAILEHQVDRGILENDLREMVSEAGAELIEGAVLQDIEIGKGEEDHAILFKMRGSDDTVSVKARWVIDATGRRQFIARKLRIRQEFEENCSATWFRVKGRYDMADLVPRENHAWHDRVSQDHPFLKDFTRYNSTNHVMGYGYWIWVIPLVSGYTSIGIVTHNDIHKFSERNSLAKTKQWMNKHDKAMANYLEEFEVLDFKMMANYAHTASHIYSEDRWACTGEAGLFSDPFQSPGTDMIAISNCYIKEMIHSDLEGKFSLELVNSMNQEVLDYSRTLTQMIQASYASFSDGTTGTLSVMWYLAWAMSFIVPNMRFRIYKDGHITKEGSIDPEEYTYIKKINQLGLHISRFIRDWSMKKRAVLGAESSDDFEFLAPWDIPFFSEFRSRMLSQKSPQWEGNLTMLKHFACAIFLSAIEEVLPAQYATFDSNTIPDAFAISMNPDLWEQNSLFHEDADVDPAKVREIKEQLHAAFHSQIGSIPCYSHL